MRSLRDFFLSLAMIAGIFAVMVGFGWLVNWSFDQFGIVGPFAVIAVTSAALTAAMGPMHGPGPR